MTSKLASFSSYGSYSSSNYGAHCLCFSIGGLSIYFSYKTPIAFRGQNGLVVRQNDWGPTTGKHLNWIDGGRKSSRVPGEEFERLLEKELQDTKYIKQFRVETSAGRLVAYCDTIEAAEFVAHKGRGRWILQWFEGRYFAKRQYWPHNSRIHS